MLENVQQSYARFVWIFYRRDAQSLVNEIALALNEKISEETHDSGRRFRCADSARGVYWGRLCTDEGFHLDNN